MGGEGTGGEGTGEGRGGEGEKCCGVQKILKIDPATLPSIPTITVTVPGVLNLMKTTELICLKSFSCFSVNNL